jgi:UPF0716 protein FxsA
MLVVYAVVELAALFALVSTIGWGWTLLALLATFVLGWGFVVPFAGSHLLDQVTRLRNSPSSGLKDPYKAFGDSALVTVATLLVLVPGLVTTALGLLLLAPPVRAVVRPWLPALAGRRRHRTTDRDRNPDYIEGEVLGVRDTRHVRDYSGFPGFPDFADAQPPVLPYGSHG